MINAIVKNTAFRLAATLVTLAIGGEAMAQDIAPPTATITIFPADLIIPQSRDNSLVLSYQAFGDYVCTMQKSENFFTQFLQNALTAALTKDEGFYKKLGVFCMAVSEETEERENKNSAANITYDRLYKTVVQECKNSHKSDPDACLRNNPSLIAGRRDQTENIMAATKKYRDTVREVFTENFGPKLIVTVQVTFSPVVLMPPTP